MRAAAGWVRIAVLGVVGVALVSNPLFLYPDGGGEDSITYRVEEISNETTARQALGKDQRVLECPSERPCAIEERVLEAGAVSYDGHVQRGQSYPVVAIDSGWYLPKNDVDNGTATLTLEAVSPIEAVEHAAVPADEHRSEVRAGVRTGSVTVRGDRIEAFERNRIVSHDGSYYWNSGFHYRSAGTVLHGTGLLVTRCVLYALGVAALVSAGWRLRACSDVPDRE